MRTFFKRFFLVTGLLYAAILISICVFLIITGDVRLDKNKLTASGKTIVFYDCENQKVPLSVDYSNKTANLSDLPGYVKNAFIAVEDKRFYSHNGIDFRALMRAAVSDVTSRSFSQGGSTISQQLVKNTHLSNEKTFARKLKEMRLAIELEKKYDKDEILGFYLNGIYFGNGLYGIENAAVGYFSKSAADLSLAQAAALAATVKSPANYNPTAEKCEQRKNLVLRLMKEQGLIDETAYKAAVNEQIIAIKSEPCDYFSLAKDELYTLGFSPYDTRPVEVYTYFDKSAQAALSSLTEDNENDGEICKNGLIATHTGQIKAAVFPMGNVDCMPGSAIKPLLVYAPAFSEGLISPATEIDDSPYNFGGYSPQNYGNVYYGYTSVKNCLAKSLNVPAVRIFDGTGAEKCLDYMRKAGIDINEKTLNVALGGFTHGIKFTDLCSAYTVFTNDGVFYPPKFIKSVRIGRLSAYTAPEKGTEVFKSGTADLINDCLKECVKNGTAKALSDFNFELCAKTGTNGTKNGNTDAITVCYTSEDIIGVGLRAKSGIMPCDVTGGSAARETVGILEKLYKEHSPADIKKSENCVKERLCKLSYEDGKILLAPDDQPDKYCFESLFIKDYAPKDYSSAFTAPEVNAEIKMNGNTIYLTFNKNSATSVEIIRSTSAGETVIADTHDNLFTDKNVKDGRYSYYLLPYTECKSGKHYGKKVFIAEVYVGEKQNYAERGDWSDD